MVLPFADGSFDQVSNAFVLRNVADVKGALAEMCRVVRTGGRVVSLELTKPRLGLSGRLYDWYVGWMVPLVGGILTGARCAYDYLLPSIGGFLTPQELRALMEEVGFGKVHYRCLFLGVVVIYVGIK